jgi:excisionase family DNA binding protein
MAALAVKLEDIHEPSAEEMGAARIAARRLRKLDRGAAVSIRPAQEVGDADANCEPIVIPANVFRALINMLAEMGKGNAVAIIPWNAELTTQQAADVLNVSRPYLVKLLNDRVLPYSMVGTHRRLPARAVLSYRDKCVHARREALTEMMALDHEFGLDADDQASSED